MSAASPPRQTPLSISWRAWLQAGDWNGRLWEGPAYDAIVVGSGYGGSVAALRLAQKGYRVLLLERGSEYLPGEFPNDFSLLPKFFRANIPTHPAPMGRATGLVEVHLGQGMVAVSGNGLGGGSLINAGVAMQPDADVFVQPQWPAAIRHGPGAALEPFFAKARKELRIQPWDSSLPGGGTLAKSAALGRLGERLGVPVQGVDTTLDAGRCLRCGDCASGCNVPGAKGSLPETYLRAAVATGLVQVVTQAEVYRFEPVVSQQAFHGWRVHAFATDAQQQFTATREVFSDTRPAGTGRTLDAPMLFICAGALGSTQLLQRSQARVPHRLAFSPALGTRVSANGDSLSWVADEPEVVASLGQGQAGTQAWEQAQQTGQADAAKITGPTITALLDLRRDGRIPLEQRLVVEDGAVPRAIAQVYRELLATASTLKSLDDWWFRKPPGGAGEDPLAASELRAQHSQVLLVMGHDGSPARLVWLDGSDRSAPYLTRPDELRTYQEQEKLFARIGARHVPNPLWRAIPAAATELMSGPKPGPTLSTVHPLGGCVMHDDPECGVVNDLGQVWMRDPGQRLLPEGATELPGRAAGAAGERNEPRLHRGLYVLDGAIVPTSLGCNPLWTITALAERALDAIPCKPGAPLPQVRVGDDRAPQALPSTEVRIDASLHEVLLADAVPARSALARALGSARAAVRFEADFRTPDIHAAMRAVRHPLAVQADLYLGRAKDKPEDAQPQVLLHYRAEGGRFEPLPANRGSSGVGLTLRCALEAAVVLGSLVAVVAGPLLGVLGVRGAAVSLLVAAIASVLLPFPRTVWTWIVLRAVRDFPNATLAAAGPATWMRYGAALARQLVHASEKRVMTYRVPLVREGDANDRLMLHARKTVVFRASAGQLLRWCWHRAQGRSSALRPTFWEQVMNAQVRVLPRGRPRWGPALLAGTFRMGFDNLTSSGLSAARRHARGAMELGRGGDTTSGMLALASYPMLFLRFALKTRLLDFRLPTYSELPRPDCAPEAETRLRLPNGGFAPAQLHWVQAERGSSSGDAGDESLAPLRLPLWRYRARDANDQPVDTPITEGRWMGIAVQRARAVLLLHAFAQSGYTYSFKGTQANLAEALQRAGFEVWVLEMRMSTRSGYADDPCAIDQIAAHDVPAAVDHILATIRAEQPGRALERLQIAAFAQCIGSAATWMALLSGQLSYPESVGADGPQLSKLSHFMSSQVHPWLLGARGTQAKTWLPALLQAVWRRGAIPFAVRGPQQGVFLPMLDRVLATLPAPALEDRRTGGHEDAAATCRRIRFIEAPLFKPENINAQTLAEMNLLFGDANLRLFTQARRFVDRERLVDEDGVNRYVTDANVRRHAALPIQLLHGADNELFDAGSASRSWHGLGNHHGPWQQAFCRRLDGEVGPVLVPGHGHLDVLIGEQAPQRVFPEIVHFLASVLQVADHTGAAPPPAGWAARPPRIGPFVGWLREAQGAPLLRVSFVTEEDGLPAGQDLPPVVLRYRPAGGQGFVTWPGAVHWQVLLAGTDVPQGVAQRVAWADLPLQGALAAATEFQLFTLHEAWHSGDLKLLYDIETSHPEFDAKLDAYLQQRVSTGNPVHPPLAQAFRPASDAVFRLPPHALATLPAACDGVSFAVASCRHPGLGLDQSRVDLPLQHFLAGGRAQRASFAMLLGDQIYADATAGLVDPTSPLERYFERHETAFRRDALGQLLAAMPVYMTPDDHEWGDGFPLGSPLVREPWPDWHYGSPYAQRERRAWEVAGAAVTAFQRLQSPQGPKARPWYTFEHGCMRFFVIDTRFARKRQRPEMVNPRTLVHLRRWLRAAPPDMLNVVASGSVALPGTRMDADPANPGCSDTWQYAPRQRRRLLQLLVDHAPRRFLLLSGDYHLSGAALVQQDGRTVGAAVLAPPLYAPMPYANATPEAVDGDEVLALAGGALRLVFPPGGRVARGSGLGLLDVQRANGAFTVSYRRDLWVWETGSALRATAKLRL